MSKLTEFIMDNNTFIIMIIILIVSCFSVAKVNLLNGRIEMCNELGLYYTNDDNCLPCELTGRSVVNGKCTYIGNKIVPFNDSWTFKGVE